MSEDLVLMMQNRNEMYMLKTSGHKYYDIQQLCWINMYPELICFV